MRTIVTILLLMITTTICAQQIDTRKYIEVTGSAEMSIQPDEVVLEIVLGDTKKVPTKKLKDIESDFNAVLKKHGIKPESVQFDSASTGYWYYWWHRRGNIDMRTVNLTLDGNTDIFALVRDLNKDWVNSIRIVKSDHKDMAAYRKQVKIEAIKAAKEKASYLLESVGQKAGGILSVEELPEAGNDVFVRQQSVSNEYIKTESNQAVENVEKIKLRYEIKVKFEVQ